MKISLPDALAKITHWVIIDLPFSDLCLVIHKSNFNNYQNSQKHEQHEEEQLNHKLHTEWSRAREGDFDLTGKCAWQRDRKCSTWRMRRRFAAVFSRCRFTSFITYAVSTAILLLCTVYSTFSSVCSLFSIFAVWILLDSAVFHWILPR